MRAPAPGRAAAGSFGNKEFQLVLMDNRKEQALTEVEAASDVAHQDDFDVNRFLGAMERKVKRLLTARRRVEELGDERRLQAEIANSWED